MIRLGPNGHPLNPDAAWARFAELMAAHYPGVTLWREPAPTGRLYVLAKAALPTGAPPEEVPRIRQLARQVERQSGGIPIAVTFTTKETP